jgi:Ran GTPase-activating protein (RanGAP) involved in mRNA processing and transport
MADFLSQYAAACADAATTPCAFLVATCETLDPKQGKLVTLCLRGSQPALFSHRLTDADLPPLFSALAKSAVAEHIEAIDLAFNHFTDAAGAHIASFLPLALSLQRLDVSSSGLGPESAAALAPPLAQHSALEHLSVASNDLGAKGAMDIVLAAAVMPSLRSLSLANVCADEAALIQLAITPPRSLRHLDISSSLFISPDGATVWEHFARFFAKPSCALTHLSLAKMGLSDGALALLLQALQTRPDGQACPLRLLNLTGNRLSSDACAAIAVFLASGRASLTELILNGNRILSAGANHLSRALFSYTPALDAFVAPNCVAGVVSLAAASPRSSIEGAAAPYGVMRLHLARTGLTPQGLTTLARLAGIDPVDRPPPLSGLLLGDCLAWGVETCLSPADCTVTVEYDSAREWYRVLTVEVLRCTEEGKNDHVLGLEVDFGVSCNEDGLLMPYRR